MRNISILSLFVIFSLGVIGVSSAEVKHVTAKDMTTQEMAIDIADILDDEAEIVNLIPGLKKVTDSSGKTCYTFQGVNIGDLDKENMEKLYSRVHQERTRINTENINRQLESIRNIQQLNNIARSVAIPVIPQVPPVPPSNVNVPQVQRTPAPPAQPPRR